MKTEDARAIEAAQEQFSCTEMEGQLAFIKANFSSLTEGIKCLQEKGATLEDSLARVEKKPVIWRKCQGTLIKWCQEKLTLCRWQVGKKFSSQDGKGF
jgi:hypothetical protein